MCSCLSYLALIRCCVTCVGEERCVTGKVRLGSSSIDNVKVIDVCSYNYLFIYLFIYYRTLMFLLTAC